MMNISVQMMMKQILRTILIKTGHVISPFPKGTWKKHSLHNNQMYIAKKTIELIL